jgi:hypothetical protein
VTTINDHIYVSNNSGQTWTAKGPALDWRGIAMSDDGTIMAAVGLFTPVYVSTNSGQNWTAKGPSHYWESIAMSADGGKMIAVDSAGYVYGNVSTTPPASASFGAGSTNFSAVSNLTSVPNMILVKNNTNVRWLYDVNADNQDFDSYIHMGDKYVSLNVSALDPMLNSMAVVNMTGVNCAKFELYYATGFYSSATSLIAGGTEVANASNVGGNCDDIGICTAVNCAGGVLTFTAQHFDGFGEYNPPTPHVPEFSGWALLLALGLGVVGMTGMRKRRLTR